MSTGTLIRPRLARPTTFAFGSGFGFKPEIFKKDNGTLAVKRTAVFRSGTFRDSMGIQSTWEDIHIKHIVDNYEHLRDRGIFADVPVRDGHAGWLIHGLPGNGQVIGYHTNLWSEKLKAPHDDNEYDYLLADMDITDPAAMEKIQNGTFRNRSAEIGTYTTNAEVEFGPVYMGVAYVDIPAVEGLQFSSNNASQEDRKVYVFMESKETGVGTETTTTGQATGQSAPQAPAAPSLLGVTPTPQSFSINGVAVTDPVAVQSHITALEKFQAETVENARVAFVNGLAQAGKILVTQVDGLLGFAKSLTADQYAEWTKTFEAAPASSLVGNHGGGVTNAGNAAQAQQTDADKQIETDLQVVKMHQQAGVAADQIKKAASFKRLEAAGKAPAL